MGLLGNRLARGHGAEFIRLNTRRCQACWKCVAACPNGVIAYNN